MPRLSTGERATDHGYFRSRGLGELVAVQQPVTFTARSVVREKGRHLASGIWHLAPLWSCRLSVCPWTPWVCLWEQEVL